MTFWKKTLETAFLCAFMTCRQPGVHPRGQGPAPTPGWHPLASAGPGESRRGPDKRRPVGGLHCTFRSSTGILLRQCHIWNLKGLPFNKMVVNLRKHCAFFVLINLAFLSETINKLLVTPTLSHS